LQALTNHDESGGQRKKRHAAGEINIAHERASVMFTEVDLVPKPYAGCIDLPGGHIGFV
jgi:hypothetical protein